MSPIPLEEKAATAIGRLEKIVGSMPRSRIVTSTDTYLHVEFRSAVFRFVDDVEFAIVEAEQLIHFRSASRLGHSDLGVNRKRMKSIKEQFKLSTATRTRRKTQG